MADSLYDIPVKSIHNEVVTLDKWKGKLLLFVNVASNCGFTPQYEGLEKLYKTYKDRGFVILAFPCNQFGGQEPGAEAEIESFCQLKYGVSFPLFAKIDVNGADTHPVYVKLKSAKPGLFGTEAIKWNFTKFLVDKSGKVVKRFAPTDSPESLKDDIEKLL